LTHAFLVIAPVGGAEISVVVGNDEQFADGRFQLIELPLQDFGHVRSSSYRQ
jgi:hypothetical protein